MTKRTLIFVTCVLLVIAALSFIKYQQIQTGMAMMAAGAPPPSSVEVTEARRAQWQPRVAAVGSLTARDGIEISNEVEGIIETLHIDSGQQVAAGDLLISLNDDVEQADLAAAMAQQELARTLFERNENMWKKKTISETDFDNARSSLQVAQANVKQIRARIAKKAIRAPFDGVLGIRNVSTGEYIPPGTQLISLQDNSLLYTDFAVPEKHLPDIQPGLAVHFRVSAYPEQVFIGSVQAVDARVDEATRNISIRAQLSNDDNRLRPGMYADIDLMLDKPGERIVVPATAIIFSSFGDALFVVAPNDDGVDAARRVQVVTGEQRGDLVAIEQGLEGGERVVQAGASKLQNGVPVTVNAETRLGRSE